MSRLTVETDTAASAKQLAAFLRTVKSVKKVTIEKNNSEKSAVGEPEVPYNWTNPTRPATDEEFEQMIAEAENSPLMTADEAQAYTFELIEKWRKFNSKSFA